MASRPFCRVLGGLVRRPLTVSVGLLLATAAAASLAVQVEHDFSPRAMFSGSDSLVADAEAVKRTFGHDDASLLIVLEATGAKDVLAAEALTWQARAAESLARLPDVREVRSIPALTEDQVRPGFPPERVRVPLVESLPAEYADEARARSFFERHVLAQGALLSEDRRVAALSASLAADARNLDDTRQIVARVREALEAVPLPEGYRAHVTGLPVLRVDIVDNLQADQAALIPLAGGIYLVVLALVFRRLSASLLLLATVGMGMAWTLAAMAVAGESFNLVSNVLPMLLLILGVSNGIHVISRYAEESAAGADRRPAALRTMSHVGASCFLTLATSAIGFLSLWTARSDALRSFASQAAIGMVCLYAGLVLALGALLPLIRPPRIAFGPDGRSGWLDRALVAVSGAVMRRPGVTFAATAAVLVCALLASRDVHVNSYTIETYDETHPTLRTMRLVEEKLGGLLPLDVVLTSDRPGRFLDAETARAVAEIERFAAKQPEVLFARSYVDLHRAADARFGEESESVWPPVGVEGQERMERSTRLVRRAAEDMRYSAFLTEDAAQARLSLRVRDVGTTRILDLADRLEARLAAVFPSGNGISTSVTGDAYVNARAMDTMIRDLFWSLVTASLTIFAVMALLLRSPRLGLLSAIPNLTPLLVTLGYMGLRGFEMNAGNVIVFTISLGIAVDDTIHFLYRYREERRTARDTEEAVRSAMRGAGRPMLLMGLLIICGLAVLLLSDFVPTRRFAELTIVTMLAAPLGDLILLPACLVLFAKHPPSSKAQPISSPETERSLRGSLGKAAYPLEGASA